MNKKFTYILFSLLFFCKCQVSAQRTINGRILDESLTPLFGAIVFDKDTIQLATADFDGYFSINVPDKTTKLIMSSIGFEWSYYYISKDCNYLEIILLEDAIYHYNSNRKVDRIRKKRFDDMALLIFNAYEKGLFINKTQCYTQEFIPYKPQLDVIRAELKEFRKANKKEFNELNIGDVVKIPFGIEASESEVRTYYSPCKNCTEKDYDFVIEGEIIKKNKRKLTLEIMITKMKGYDYLKYRGKILKISSNFKYEMKYYEVIID